MSAAQFPNCARLQSRLFRKIGVRHPQPPLRFANYISEVVLERNIHDFVVASAFCRSDTSSYHICRITFSMATAASNTVTLFPVSFSIDVMRIFEIPQG